RYSMDVERSNRDVAANKRRAFHAMTVDDVARDLTTDPARGLSPAEVTRRQSQFGPNSLKESPAAPLWKKLLRQFNELVIWILIVAAVISGAVGEWADTV